MSFIENWNDLALKEKLFESLSFTCAIVGIFKVGSFLWRALKGVTKYFILPRRDLFTRYGKGWAIVTGATDGLGK